MCGSVSTRERSEKSELIIYFFPGCTLGFQLMSTCTLLLHNSNDSYRNRQTCGTVQYITTTELSLTGNVTREQTGASYYYSNAELEP